MANRWLKRASAAAAAVGLALVFGGGTAWAANSRTVVSALSDVVNWGGNGTTNGVCDHIGPSDDLTPGPSQQGWVFILTSPGAGPWVLTYTFNPPGTPATQAGAQMGGGSVHFIVYSQLGATLSSASATNGTGKSNLVVSHCTAGSTTPPTTTPPTTTPPTSPSSSMTSDVHLKDGTVIDDGSHPGTAPADVHDQVTLTVTGLTGWSGVITETFYAGNNCDVNKDTTMVDVDNTTVMPISILPETILAAGEYSYQASFSDPSDSDLNVIGACEPFKIVDKSTTPPTTTPPTTTPPTTASTPPTTTTTPGLPVTGASLTGILLAAVALIAAGGGTLFFMRRRRTAAGE